jgi:protein-disulfide isomerase
MSNKSKRLPASSRRSARQQRLANREANRQFARAGTRGGSVGGDLGGLLLWTIAAVVVGVVVIGGAWMLTQQPSADKLASPIAPRILTPSDIPSSGSTLGNPDAPITIDLYSDFQCPYCQRFALEIEPKLVDEYVRTGKAKIVFHDFIVADQYTGGTSESLDASNAARCAADQGKWWRFHDWLYANQFGENVGSFTEDRLKAIGAQAGLDTARFDQCVDSGQHDSEIQAAQGQIPEEVTGSPTILVNGKKAASYALADVEALVEEVLNPSPSPSASESASSSPSASSS